MFTCILVYLSLSVGITMAAVDDCTSLQFWNGTQCVPCSKCPRGFGVKEMCSPKKDTECQPCWPEYDYSNTSSYQSCTLCDEFSNCLPGNPKKIKNCTIFSPPVCDGCEDGYYLDPDYEPNGRCLKCSPPCNIKQEETRPCSTEHDRRCSPKTTTSARPILSSPSTPSTPSTVGVDTDSSESGTEEPGPRAERSSQEETPLEKRPGFWVPFVAVVVVMVPATVFVVRCRRRQNRRGTNTNANEIPMRPLLGLDLPVKYLDIEKRKRVARMLNGKDNFGYFYWHIVAEKLDLGAECRAWEAVDNPTEKLLSAYGELEGSSMRNLVSAIRKAGLTHFANEVKKLVSTTQDQDDDDDIDAERA